MKNSGEFNNEYQVLDEDNQIINNENVLIINID